MIDKCDAFFVAFVETYYCLEKSGGYGNVFFQAARFVAVEEWSADDVERDAPVFHPIAAGRLEVFPVATVEALCLWADVGEIERFAHGIFAPFVVGSGTHVATTEPRVFVVVECGFDFVVKIRVFAKHIVALGVAV